MEISNANGLTVFKGNSIQTSSVQLLIYIYVCVYTHPLLDFYFRKDSKLDFSSAPYLNIPHR